MWGVRPRGDRVWNEGPMTGTHRYAAKLTWSGAGQGQTSSYRAYSRDYRVEIAGKPALEGSANPAIRGDPVRHNPEDLLLAALAGRHMLTYMAEAAPARPVREIGRASCRARAGHYA